MEKDMFAAVLPVVVGGLANKIIEEYGISDDEAFEKLYLSELYTALEIEETKLWTCSAARLLGFIKKEIETGILEIPGY